MADRALVPATPPLGSACRRDYLATSDKVEAEEPRNPRDASGLCVFTCLESKSRVGFKCVRLLICECVVLNVDLLTSENVASNVKLLLQL